MKRNQQKDRALLNFIQEYIYEHGYSPTIRETAIALQYKTVSSAYARMTRLRREGHLTWEDNRNRTIRLTVPEGKDYA